MQVQVLDVHRGQKVSLMKEGNVLQDVVVALFELGNGEQVGVKSLKPFCHRN